MEVVAFGLEATQAALESIGATARLRQSATGDSFITDSGNRILDCSFGPIADPARLEESQLRRGAFHAYLELHIEQGGTLDKEGTSIGIVEGIVALDQYGRAV